MNSKDLEQVGVFVCYLSEKPSGPAPGLSEIRFGAGSNGSMPPAKARAMNV